MRLLVQDLSGFEGRPRLRHSCLDPNQKQKQAGLLVKCKAHIDIKPKISGPSSKRKHLL